MSARAHAERIDTPSVDLGNERVGRVADVVDDLEIARLRDVEMVH